MEKITRNQYLRMRWLVRIIRFVLRIKWIFIVAALALLLALSFITNSGPLLFHLQQAYGFI